MFFKGIMWMDFFLFVIGLISSHLFSFPNYFVVHHSYIDQKWDKLTSLLNTPRVMISPLTHTPVPMVVVLLNPVLLAKIAKTEW